jgi:hypothetical protein
MKKILILTPDGVGSTLLQRSLCIWGNLSDIYINPHELTNGLVYKNNILVKDNSLKYSQSLDEIVELLEKNKNNLIVRLAHYHIIERNDSNDQQIKFYKYLNNNFKIISCHRNNLLDYAMSWSIRDLKSTSNVYSFKEKNLIHPKIDNFTLNTNFLIKKCNDYRSYNFWVSSNFNVFKKFYYEDIEKLDNFIEEILEDCKITVKKQFNLSLTDYCLISSLHGDFYKIDKSKLIGYVKLVQFCKNLVNLNYMSSLLPLKMNSFEQKINKCNNFNEVLKSYNDWVKTSNKYNSLSLSDINEFIEKDFFSMFEQCLTSKNKTLPNKIMSFSDIDSNNAKIL